MRERLVWLSHCQISSLVKLGILSKCNLISASSYSFHVSEQDLILCMCIFRVITGLIQRNPPCWQFLSNYHCPAWETLSLCFILRLCIHTFWVCFIFSEELALQCFWCLFWSVYVILLTDLIDVIFFLLSFLWFGRQWCALDVSL